uniref:Uncharacterized protein n=1 Tax=Rhizophora mucronata TaxID=61149 RepID=A0A2P2Q1L7_RHIMU
MVGSFYYENLADKMPLVNQRNVCFSPQGWSRCGLKVLWQWWKPSI